LRARRRGKSSASQCGLSPLACSTKAFATTKLREKPAAETVKLYLKEFTAEERFRDIEDLQFGLGVSDARIGSSAQCKRLLLARALAIALLTCPRAAGDPVGTDNSLETNTVQRRALALANRGLDRDVARPNT
jgi:hypothetical protein